MATGGAGGYGTASSGGAGGASNQAGKDSTDPFDASGGGAAGASPGGNGTNGMSATGYQSGGGGGGGADGTFFSSGGGGAGGDGGDGGNGGGGSTGGGGGGAGGNGLVINNFGITGGTIYGGAGGAGGAGGYGVDNGGSAGNGGNGGGGGAGIVTAGEGRGQSVYTASGVIIAGGAGGAGGAGSTGNAQQDGQAGKAGAGGAGIIGDNLAVVNNGTIRGGLSGDGTTQADAITFTGGTQNSLTLGGTLEGGLGITGTLTLEGNEEETTLDNLIHNTRRGAGSIVFDGGGSTGSLTLSGTDTYTGSTTITNGFLFVGGDTIAASSGVLVASSGHLETDGDTSIKSLADSAPGQAGHVFVSGTLTLTDAAGTFSGAIDGPGGLVLARGHETLAGNNSYSGGTTIEGGTLSVSSDANLGDSGGLAFTGGTLDMTIGFTTSRDVSIAGTGTVRVDAGTGEIDGVISDGANPDGSGTVAGRLVVEGVGNTLVLGNSGNSYSGGTIVRNGATVSVSADSDLGNPSGALTLQQGNLLVTAGGFETRRAVRLEGGGQLAANQGVDAIFDGTISGSHLRTAGEGTITLTADNTYTGYTVLGAADTVVSSNANLGRGGGAIYFVNGADPGVVNETLEMTQGFTTFRDIKLFDTGVIQVDNGTGTIAGVISDGDGSGGTPGTLVESGGTLRLTGTNTYSGGTVIDGTLEVYTDANLGSTIGDISYGFFGTLEIGRTGFSTARDLTLGAFSTIEVGANIDATFTGTISDAPGESFGSTLIINGDGGGVVADAAAAGTPQPGKVTLTGTNTFSGGVEVFDATLAVGTDANLGAASGEIDLSFATLEITKSGFRTTRDVFLGGPAGVQVDKRYAALAGVIADGGGDGGIGGVAPLGVRADAEGGDTFYKFGDGTLNLGRANTYSGGTVIVDGTLDLNHSTATDSDGTITSGAAGTGTDITFEPGPDFDGGGSGFANLLLSRRADPGAGGTFAYTLDDFGASDTLDLRAMAFSAGATASVSGTLLTVTSGGRSESFELGGDSAASFSVASDGHGGTLVGAGTAGLVAYSAGPMFQRANATQVPLLVYGGPGLAYKLHEIVTASGEAELVVHNGVNEEVIDLGPATQSLDLNFAKNTAAVSLTGAGGGDVLIGGGGDDTILGGKGNDVLTGNLGTNTLNGGAGTDKVDYSASRHAVVVDLGAGTGHEMNGTVELSSDDLVSIENARGSRFDDTLIGGSGRNVLEGGAGADTIIAGGTKTIASYLFSKQGVTVDLSLSGAQQSGGDASGDVLEGIENVYGSTHADTLTGDDASNVLTGGGGADTLHGGGGNDLLVVRGTPTLVDGGAGNDRLEVKGAAVLSDASFENIERVSVANDGSLDMSRVTTAPSLIASLSKADGHASIVGTQGDDRIVAGAGTDRLTGGLGDDVYIAGSGADTFNELMAGFGRDSVFNADLAADTFDVRGLAKNASGLVFTAIHGGADTMVTGMHSAAGDALILHNVTTAEAMHAHFTFAAPKG